MIIVSAISTDVVLNQKPLSMFCHCLVKQSGDTRSTFKLLMGDWSLMIESINLQKIEVDWQFKPRFLAPFSPSEAFMHMVNSLFSLTNHYYTYLITRNSVRFCCFFIKLIKLVVKIASRSNLLIPIFQKIPCRGVCHQNCSLSHETKLCCTYFKP